MNKKIEDFLYKFKIEIALILMMIISISYFHYKGLIYWTNISSTQLFTAIGGIATIWLLFKRDKKSQKQVEHTRIQIGIQEKTRKDQQFLDSIKLIEENNNNLGGKLGGLTILENLARENPKYRQRILVYLGIYTEKLRKITDNLRFEVTTDNLNQSFSEVIAFKQLNFSIEKMMNKSKKMNNFLKIGNEYIEFKNDIVLYENFQIKILIEDFNIHTEQIGVDETIDIDIYIYQLEIKCLDKNQEMLKNNLHEYLENNNLKFEKQCLLLAEKIINMYSKKSYDLVITDIFLPFINITNQVPTKVNLFAYNEFNLIGVYFDGNKTKDSNFKYWGLIPNYSIIQNCEKLQNHRNKIINVILVNIKALILPYQFKESTLVNVNINYSSTLLSPGSMFEFERCYFRETKFMGEKKCWAYKDKKEEIKMFPKFSFIECDFSYKVEFNNIELQELYFKNCSISKEYPIIGLDTVTILSNDKTKLIEMIKGFKELISKDSNIKIPKFKYENLVKKELSELKNNK